MVTHEITFRILLTPDKVRFALLLLFLGALPRMAATAEVATLETYYPPTTAAHNTLTVYGDAVLARDGERIIIGSEDNTNVYVAVGRGQATVIGGNAEEARTLVIKGTLRVDGCIWLRPDPNGPPPVKSNFRCKFEP